MNIKELNRTIEDLIDRCLDTLGTKGKEYVDKDGDRLDNFKSAAAALNITTAEALLGMYIKHFVSVRDLVRRVYDENNVNWIEDLIKLRTEKIPDSINYHFLLDCVLADEFGVPPDDESKPEVTYTNGNGYDTKPDTPQITLFDYLQEIADDNLAEQGKVIDEHMDRAIELARNKIKDHDVGSCGCKND